MWNACYSCFKFLLTTIIVFKILYTAQVLNYREKEKCICQLQKKLLKSYQIILDLDMNYQISKYEDVLKKIKPYLIFNTNYQIYTNNKI